MVGVSVFDCMTNKKICSVDLLDELTYSSMFSFVYRFAYVAAYLSDHHCCLSICL